MEIPAYNDDQQDAPDEHNYNPSEQEQKLIKQCEKLFDEAKRYKSNFDEKWNDYFNMFRGRQWKDARPSYRHAEVINLIFREIQSFVPIMTDTRPKFEFMPMEPSDQEFAKILNQVAEYDWVKNNWSFQLAEIIYDSYIFGTGIGSMEFDPEANYKLGKMKFSSEDPFYIFPDPKSKNVNDGGKYFIEIELLDLKTIKKKWENGKYVTADLSDIKKADLFDKDKTKVVSPTSAYAFEGNAAKYDMKEQAQALVMTVYQDGDSEIIEEKEMRDQEDGTQLEVFVKKQKYPKGRKTVIANKVLLADEPLKEDDGKFPYARLVNYINQRQFWGISEVEQLESPQKIFNKLISFTLDVLTLMGNPIWKVGTGSGVDTEMLVNAPGLVVEADNIDQVRREEGVQLQPYVLQLIDRIKGMFDDISGSSDVSRGVKPEGVTAASAIQSLQEATYTRLRQKSRNLDAFLQDLGQLYVSRVLQYYTAPQVYRLTNDDGSQKYFKFHVEHLDDGQKMFRYREIGQDENGQVIESEEKARQIMGEIDVKVSTGSVLPFAKAEKESRLLNYFDRGIIDAEEVLKGAEYPNWEAVLQRVNEQKAQAQMQAQGQAPQ